MLVTILFYIFAVGLLFSAIKVVTVKNPVQATLWLVLTFAFSAMQWVLMQAEFLGIVLLMVYVGAVMVLFIFVVMMLNIDVETLRAGFWRNLPLSFAIGILLALLLILILISPDTQLSTINNFVDQPKDYNSVREIGRQLFTKDYIIAFELAAVILLLGMVAAIALVHKKSTQHKRMQPKDQVKVTANKDRMELLKMEPVRKPKNEEVTEKAAVSTEEVKK